MEIVEKDEEEENESLLKQKKNNINNDSEIFFNQNKKMIFNNNKNVDNESKNNDIINNNNYGENDIFNNHISNKEIGITKNNNYLHTNNNIGSVNKNINCFWIKKKISNNNRYKKLNSRDDNLRNQKLTLPNLNLGNNKNKRYLSSNKTNIFSMEELSSVNNQQYPIKKYKSHSVNNHHEYSKENKDNIDNIKINLFSSISNSTNVIIPIIYNQNGINNLNTDINNKIINHNRNYLNTRNNKKFNILTLNTEENKNNKINEFTKNISNESDSRKNYLIQKINKEKESSKNNYNDLLLNIDNTFMLKLHKIKIQKGMMGNKICERLKDNLLINDYNCKGQITSEDNKSNDKLPLINKNYERNYISKSRENKKYKMKYTQLN